MVLISFIFALQIFSQPLKYKLSVHILIQIHQFMEPFHQQSFPMTNEHTLNQTNSYSGSDPMTSNSNRHLTRQLKQLKISSQAYPLFQEGEPPYENIKQPTSSDTTVGQKKKILKPQVKSKIHQKLLKINFSVQKHQQPIKVRQFQMADLQELKNLQDEWFPIKYSDQFYQKIIKKECYCLVAETAIKISHDYDSQQHCQVEQKILVGAAVFQLTDSQGYAHKSWSQTFINWFRISQDSIYIMTLGVIDQFRKKGVGKLLIDSIIETANLWKNVKLIYLHVISYNKAAIYFYQKIGFTNIETLYNFYHLGGKQFDGQVYGMFLNGGKNGNKWSQWLRRLFK